MKTILCTLTLSLLVSFTAMAQPRAKLEKELTNFLNKVLMDSERHHPFGEGVKMVVDSPFAISPSGELSLTVRYIDDSSTQIIRSVAPLHQMESVVLDVYLSLSFGQDGVKSFAREGSRWKSLDDETLFFIGHVNDDLSKHAQAEKIWNKLKKYYK